MQLYRLKYEKPAIFEKIKYALHLPQYLSYILTSKLYSDITSIGSHTNLWNFQDKKYHEWVNKEGIAEKLPPILSYDKVADKINSKIPAGGGLHDSSSALIPYFISFHEPFVLLSTGTWCITINPFNNTMLSDYELDEDCLCYLSYEGKPVKASRLFAGYEHEQQVKRLSDFFKKPIDHYSSVKCDLHILAALNKKRLSKQKQTTTVNQIFNSENLRVFIV
jgi:Sugar (pentulose and hexulose) kinases